MNLTELGKYPTGWQNEGDSIFGKIFITSSIPMKYTIEDEKRYKLIEECTRTREVPISNKDIANIIIERMKKDESNSKLEGFDGPKTTLYSKYLANQSKVKIHEIKMTESSITYIGVEEIEDKSSFSSSKAYYKRAETSRIAMNMDEFIEQFLLDIIHMIKKGIYLGEKYLYIKSLNECKEHGFEQEISIITVDAYVYDNEQTGMYVYCCDSGLKYINSANLFPIGDANDSLLKFLLETPMNTVTLQRKTRLENLTFDFSKDYMVDSETGKEDINAE